MTRTDKGKKFSEIYRMLNKSLRYAAIFCAVFIFIIGFAHSANAATFTVMTTADNGDNTMPTANSLRAAIIAANATTVTDTIVFSGAGVGTISPPTSLPAITQRLIIDGYTGSGATMPSSIAPATLTIELNGANAGASGIGLRFSAANCTLATCQITGLAINRFQNSGIRLDAGSVTVSGNFIGTNLNGITNICGTAPTVLCGNVNRGILISGSTGNAIGGTTFANINVISANQGTGISITNGGSALVRRNLIGTDKNGTADLGNTQEGVRIVDSSNSSIGGANAGARNIISGNNGSGVSILQSSPATSATGNTIGANFIGVDSTGNTALPNNGSGIIIGAGGNTVGGNRTTSATMSVCTNACNVIAGNAANGVSLNSSFATGNTISGNNIGVGADNTTTLGNRDNGIQIASLAAGNTIGGTDVTAGFCNNTCNMIANNGDAASTTARAGIYVDATGGAGNTIRSNSIFDNGSALLPPPPITPPTFNGLGIDLGTPNTTANDAMDPDTGPNNLQNFPVINTANTANQISGTLNSTPSTVFTLDFYLNSTIDGLNSEGRTYIGSLTNVTTGGGGDAPFVFNSTVTLPFGQFVTATATANTTADTSEFSAPRIILAATAAPATVKGRVVLQNGRGLSRALVQLTNDNGEIVQAVTNQFGYFQFNQVETGQGYTVSVQHKRYKSLAQFVQVNSDVEDLIIVIR